ncbi:ubiquitin domain-containing protein ubfd1 [Anaeramoeba flamelloides]|uniref:Ubiquitin domain-containing protein ubfd1 n=2 Tax=Anaeramoeba flamelloides TaxID=1746091 RepID=A0AAV7YAG8_9EUKA|nr:ubiquitin domain-containing protein ubfd1 [Anaeramoeba flamelloides]KAJ3425561.1 ubiquitin domain-containing protein ubfd1 [Anaeramoeba flamelloides]KAJ6236729.1 ubiquitin domain-containing protein ubfd1 [Anaeramoeba flamelloides]|eukprot:Anaeramoba_flamelloidesc42000_g1_i3.p1 GENE.c42000_g1_i3~~c42000_g1_i3.p1  ORF type:complete len:234 (-),score=58.36 c42000_g1_i3:77-778(-)
MSEIKFKLKFRKQLYPITMQSTDTIGKLKEEAERLTGIPINLQKVMYKGMQKNNKKTLESAKFKNNCKVLIIGSTFKEITKANVPLSEKDLENDVQDRNGSEDEDEQDICTQKEHLKILEKGIPSNAHVGIKNKHYPLPTTPIRYVFNEKGDKVQLIFKFTQDQLWIGSSKSTKKIPLSHIKKVYSQRIPDIEQYSVLGLQIGNTKKSTVWLYFVPTQFIRAIKNSILGEWGL